MKISNINTINFNGMFENRVLYKTADMGFFKKNFGGGVDEAETQVEREMFKEMDAFERRKAKADAALGKIEKEFNKKSAVNEAKIRELDKSIEEEKTVISSQNATIDKLKGNLKSSEEKIEKNNSEWKKTTEKVDKLKQKQEKLSIETDEVNRQIAQIDAASRGKVNEKLTEKRKEYGLKVQEFMQSPQIVLSKDVITPLNLLQKGYDVQVPNGIIIEAEGKFLPKLVMSWLLSKVQANKSTVNSKKYDTKEAFWKELNNVSYKSKLKNAEDGTHTFTVISSGEDLMGENKPLVPFMKNFMDTTANDNHNTIVLIAKSIKAFDPILMAKHRFPVRISLDKSFYLKGRNGFWGMFKEVAVNLFKFGKKSGKMSKIK